MCRLIVSILVCISTLLVTAPLLAQDLTIMPVGDSLTVGLQGGYRKPLFENLKEHGFILKETGSKFSSYEAYRGATVGQLNKSLLISMGKYAPDIILLMVGTNDAASGRPASMYQKRLSSLVKKVFTAYPCISLYISEIPLIKGKEHIVRKYNKVILDVVLEYTSKYNIFLVEGAEDISFNHFSKDGVHLKPSGYKILSSLWFNVLRDTLNRDQTCLFD